ncbi:MAG: 30S ribosomal protein S15 [Patescibacteria group bacterium]
MARKTKASTKKQVIDQFATHAGDTGSPEVQIALLSQRIGNVSDHLKGHGHDDHSRRGLLSMINKRRRLLHYLTRKFPDRYKEIINKLELPR